MKEIFYASTQVLPFIIKVEKKISQIVNENQNVFKIKSASFLGRRGSGLHSKANVALYDTENSPTTDKQFKSIACGGTLLSNNNVNNPLQCSVQILKALPGW